MITIKGLKKKLIKRGRSPNKQNMMSEVFLSVSMVIRKEKDDSNYKVKEGINWKGEASL